jgi:hypothetical protein
VSRAGRIRHPGHLARIDQPIALDLGENARNYQNKILLEILSQVAV